MKCNLPIKTEVNQKDPPVLYKYFNLQADSISTNPLAHILFQTSKRTSCNEESTCWVLNMGATLGSYENSKSFSTLMGWLAPDCAISFFMIEFIIATLSLACGTSLFIKDCSAIWANSLASWFRSASKECIFHSNMNLWLMSLIYLPNLLAGIVFL